jgi:magnesium transporter
LVKVFRRYHYLAVPVISDDGTLLGVITQDDALRVAEKQADEELLRFTGIAGGDEFRVMPLRRRSGRRLSWLSINILLNVVAASVIALYQETLQAVIALAVFLPIISDMSGCSGNQAVAVSIRELSLDRIRPRDFLWVAGKELSVGLFNGLALGMIIGLVAWIWKGNGWLGAIVGAALWINTLVAVTIGGLVPLILRRFRQDPAIASGAILTTLTDMCGFFMVLGLASRYLHLLE